MQAGQNDRPAGSQTVLTTSGLSAQSERFLQQLRQQIDRLDDRLMVLLRQRVEVARQLGLLKRASSLPLRDAQRERAVLARLTRAGGDTLPPAAVGRIFQCIIAATLEAEQEDESAC